MKVDNKKRKEKCKCCGGDVKIANPTGYCNHVYYPENCDQPCMKPTQPDKKSMEERFEQFHKSHSTFMGGVSSNMVKHYKQFILNELARQRQELIERVERLGTLTRWKKINKEESEGTEYVNKDKVLQAILVERV